jgi:hypothetical protein
MSVQVLRKKRPQVAPEKPVAQEKFKDEAVYKMMYNLRVAHEAINKTIDNMEERIIENYNSKDYNCDIHICLEDVYLSTLEAHKRKKCAATYMLVGDTKRSTYYHPITKEDYQVRIVRNNTAIRLELTEQGKRNVKDYVEGCINKKTDIKYYG